MKDSYQIENDHLEVKIKAFGAELCSVINKETGIEYLWDAKPEIWSKHSPILFPFVGTLKENQYEYQGKKYAMERHGFARNMMFEVILHTSNSLSLLLRADDHTLSIYPFPFTLEVNYSLIEQELKVSYRVTNEGNKPMYFGIGGHPAFKLPLDPNLKPFDYEIDCSFELINNEPILRYPITLDGLLDEPIFFSENTTFKIHITPETFKKDAIVLKNIRSAELKISSPLSSTYLSIRYNGFPHLGIWSKPETAFVCLEPWQGHADSFDHSGKLEEKKDLVTLQAQDQWEGSWNVITG